MSSCAGSSPSTPPDAPSLSVFKVVNDARSTYGLRHQDFGRYQCASLSGRVSGAGARADTLRRRSHCTTKLAHLRKAAGLTQIAGKAKKYARKDVTPTNASSEKYVPSLPSNNPANATPSQAPPHPPLRLRTRLGPLAAPQIYPLPPLHLPADRPPPRQAPLPRPRPRRPAAGPRLRSRRLLPPERLAARTGCGILSRHEGVFVVREGEA